MIIRITKADGRVPGKLADVELRWVRGPLAGLKLVGFTVWSRDPGPPAVTFPARDYIASNGRKQTFSLLRPICDPAALQPLTRYIVDAYLQSPDGEVETEEPLRWEQ